MGDMPFEFFCTEMNTSEPQKQLQSIQRMRVICLALGPDKTRQQLLSYIKGEIMSHKYQDEVLVAIAFNLGRCVDYIGPLSNLACLLDPLETLCSIEETTVRDEAVNSLNLICKQIEPAQVKNDLLPIILKLAKHMDWFTPRVSACGLFALAMTKVGSDESCSKDLREAFMQLGIDETPMVRRAAALQLSEFAKALGDSLVTDHLLPLYRTLLADEQDSVRVNALKSTPMICKLIGNMRESVLKDNFKKCVADKSWRVRVACAEVIADTAESCTSDADALVVVKEIYSMLQHDHEAEVRVATALRAAGVSSALGPEFGKDPIFPILKELVNDPNSISRLELSGVMMDMARPLGKQHALELVMPVMTELLGEDNTNLRLAVINKLAAFIEVVEAPSVVKLISRLGKDKNWRVRHAVLCLLPKLAESMGEKEFDNEFSLGVENDYYGAKDTNALIRSVWCKTMAEIGKTFGGESWLSKHVVPILEERKSDKSYQMRAVVLEGASLLAHMISSEVLQTKLCPHILEMSDDQVPNLRIDAMKALEGVCPHVTAEYKTSKIVPKLKERIEDDDQDVRHYAKQALAVCNK